MKQPVLVVFIWAFASFLAMAFASLQLDAAMINGQFIPFGNDSFYHARRILDAVGERGFYQFDSMIHLPEGSWISWSWGYDYVLAIALKAALWINPGLDKMKFLVYVPVFWVPVNVALLLAVGRTMKLPLELLAFSALAMALLPLLQMLHVVGRIDHHFMELTFVLLASWRTVRWFDRQSVVNAAACGIALGLAPAAHHALFILQLPLVVAVGVLWFRSVAPMSNQLRAAGLALFVTSILVILPSEPFRDGQFSLGTLSGFHLYAAFASALILYFLSWRGVSRKQVALLCGLVVLLALPVLSQIVLGSQFLSGALFQANSILEVASPFAMIAGDWGLTATLGFYSGLLLFAPFVLLAFLWRLVRGTDAAESAFGVFAVFGLGLLLMQFRLNYFGLAFMILGPLVLLKGISDRRNWSRPLVALAVAATLAAALQPGLAGGLFTRYHAGGDHFYEVAAPLFADLDRECRQRPATVIVSHQLGHYVRFHSDCPVIANNFLLTEQHFEKAGQVAAKFDESPRSFRATLNEPVYLLAFLWGALDIQGGLVEIENVESIQMRNPRLLVELFFGDPLPDGYEIINNVSIEVSEGRGFPVARLYKVQPLP
ncbi:MAG: hypothetical protein HKN59_07875 [Gammaproteobacteria bacterium]|nr:hypothetical protein [Gammaproteobacteria bacterium]